MRFETIPDCFNSLNVSLFVRCTLQAGEQGRKLILQVLSLSICIHHEKHTYLFNYNKSKISKTPQIKNNF